MSDASNTSVPTDSKPPRPPKPAFPDFLTTLRTIIALPANTGLPQLRKALAIGFAEKENPQLLSQLTVVLRTCAWIDRWAVQAAVSDAAGKLKRRNQHVLAALRSDYARETGFLELQHHNTFSAQDLETWVATALREHQHGPKEASPLPVDTWVRRTFICLLGQPAPEKRFEAILTFIQTWASHAPQQQHTASPDAVWYRFLGSLMSSEQPKRSRIAPIMTGLHAIKDQLTTSLNRERRLERDIHDRQAQIAELTTTAVGLHKDVTNARAISEEQANTIATLENQIREEQERYRLLDEHWKRSAATATARKVGSLSQEIGHEVDEITLSLDQATPNLSMALNRLRRLQTIIKRQTGNRED